MKKYYLDTCIWIDYYENRTDNFRPLGEWAFKLIKMIIKERYCFIICDHLIKELENRYSAEAVLEIVPEELIIRVSESSEQFEEAIKTKRKLKIPLGDAIHLIISRDNDAILISRDKHLYELSKDIMKPEELI